MKIKLALVMSLIASLLMISCRSTEADTAGGGPVKVSFNVLEAVFDEGEILESRLLLIRH